MIKFIKPEFTHIDNRGSLQQLVSKGWTQVNVIKSSGGAVRGNHWHEQTSELFYCLQGSFMLRLQKADELQVHEIREGDMFVVEPFVRHTFSYHEDTIMIALYDKGVELPDGCMDIHTAQLPVSESEAANK